ncbi:GPI inositol deacylase [Malassezia nana]|uniref:GPI inositol-deacylase n=1 Tax=Malassezia nana TaxID=180528 RepID=A0AAF0EK25_9BASI|nr:GPI inositol deacylase [Malassezia nana]
MQGRRRGEEGAVLMMLAGIVALCAALLWFASLPHMLDMRMECRMARMRPSYVVHDEELRAFSSSGSPLLHKYSLREYREMGAKQPLRFGEIKLEPMPVLFIPGNAGSYAQVRSLAASAWDQYWLGRMEVPAPDFRDAKGPLQWYTIDFNEDFSAFHGKTLLDQAFFVNEALRYLQYLHPSAENGTLREGERSATVALVGHSMGGIVARLALELDNYLPGSVDTIVTLSSPHAFPPVPFDRSIDWVYQQINRAHSDADPHPLVISLAGGVLDTQLSSDASSLSLARLGPPVSRLSSFTTSVNGLWSSTDHLAIVWCDQLRTKVARALLRDYAHYGRLYEDRTAFDVRAARHELWRSILGISNDASSASERRRAALAAAHEPGGTLLKNTQLMPIDLTNRESALLHHLNVKDVQVRVFKALSPPGPRQTYTGNVTEDDEALGFEIVTNLSVGPNTERDAPYPQTHELFVALCSRRLSLEPMSEYPEPAFCYPVLSHAYEQLPWSPTAPTPFPQAQVAYAKPPYHLHRLFLSHEFLRAHHIESVRVEYNPQPAALPTQQHVPTILRMGWTESQPLLLHGKPSWLRSKTWELPGVSAASLLSSFGDHAALWHWHAPELDSALIAYRVTLEPAPCALAQDPPAPRMGPMLRILSASTSDARIVPSLDIRAPNDVVIAMHGAAPFMPPPTESGLRFQLWLLDAYASSSLSGVYSSQCPLPFARLRVAVHWRASIALLVLRYRIALIVWPLGVLALARLVPDPPRTPFAALAHLMTPPWLAVLVGAPIALHVLLHSGAALGAPPYALGIGLRSLAFWWLGPVLSVLAYAVAILSSLLVELGLHIVYLVVRRVSVPRTEPFMAPIMDTWPSRRTLVAWAQRRSTWVGACLFLGCIVFLPHQVLVLVCTLVHAATTFRSYMAREDSARLTLDPERRRPWQERHMEHMWLLQCLVWLLPLHAPVLVVWVRNVNAGFSMGLLRVEHNVLATAALLALVYMHAAPWTLPALDSHGPRLGTYIVYGGLALSTLVYGLRYGYVLYEVFVILLAWELGQRLWPLARAMPSEDMAHEMEPIHHLALPSALASSAPPAIERLLAEYLDTLEAYMQARTRANDAMQAGFLQLARAKMALGGTYGQRISSDAYDARMSAQLRVAPAPRPEEPCTLSLRRRMGADAPTQDAPVPGSEADRSSMAHGYDPLFQFSGLPPPALKAAQRHFCEAAAHLIAPTGTASMGSDVWELQRRLAALEQQIDTCRRT